MYAPDDYTCIEIAYKVDYILAYLQTNRGDHSQGFDRTVPDGGAT